MQEKCSREGLTEEHVQEMKERIEAKGYEAFDLSTDQLGFDKNGKLCLIDPECARDNKKYEAMKKQNDLWMLKHGLEIDYI